MRSLRHFVIPALACIMLSTNIYAATPWEEYVAFPSPENAKKVFHATYSNEEYKKDHFFYDLNLLEIQIISGDKEAVRLAFRLLPESDGAYSEALDIMLGRLIRINAELFLQELKKYNPSERALGPIVGNFGEPYVDKAKASIYEAMARISSLKKVRNPDLENLRDRCVGQLREDIEQYRKLPPGV